MPRYVYAYECGACEHLASDHRLTEDGDIRAGPYVCRVCGCEMAQDSPCVGLDRRQFEQRFGASGPELEQCIVLRVHPDLPEHFMPAGWEGRWFDVARFADVDPAIRGLNGDPVARLVRTDRFERRDDGLTARVYEVQPLPGLRGYVQPDYLRRKP